MNVDKAPTAPIILSRATTTCAVGTNTPLSRSLHTATAISHYKLFVFGGWHKQCNESSASENCSSSTKNFSPIYTSESERQENDNGCFLSDGYILDTVRMQWQQCEFDGSKETQPGPRCGHSAVAIAGRVYIFGGETASGPTNQLYVYDWESRQFSFNEHAYVINKSKILLDKCSASENVLPLARSGHTAAVCFGISYCFKAHYDVVFWNINVRLYTIFVPLSFIELTPL